MPDDDKVLAHFLELNDQHRTTIELTMLEGILLTKLAEASMRILSGKSPFDALAWVSRLGSINPEIVSMLAAKLDSLHTTARKQFDSIMPDIVEHAIKDLIDDVHKEATDQAD